MRLHTIFDETALYIIFASYGQVKSFLWIPDKNFTVPCIPSKVIHDLLISCG